MRTYLPTLTSEQQNKVAEWRSEVKNSIENDDATYVRETIYDRLLGLLFPQMQSALNNPFGTPLQILKNDYDAFAVSPEPTPMQFRTSDDAFLRGREFTEWARRNPDAAKLWLDSPAGKQYQESGGNRNDCSQQYSQWKRKSK